MVQQALLVDVCVINHTVLLSSLKLKMIITFSVIARYSALFMLGLVLCFGDLALRLLLALLCATPKMLLGF